ncbi:MAG: 4Fe-4S dicluster domain-containing protein [Euryarchaeota archaeon]|nr:4Fe-4S dicluster domain-containing protein [Euryarchaeota archaeon]
MKKKIEPIHLFSRWCKKCGICIAFCPKHVLEFGPDGYPYAARPEDCILCGLCDIHCPDYAITVAKKDEYMEKITVKEENHETAQSNTASGQ